MFSAFTRCNGRGRMRMQLPSPFSLSLPPPYWIRRHRLLSSDRPVGNCLITVIFDHLELWTDADAQKHGWKDADAAIRWIERRSNQTGVSIRGLPPPPISSNGIAKKGCSVIGTLMGPEKIVKISKCHNNWGFQSIKLPFWTYLVDKKLSQ